MLFDKISALNCDEMHFGFANSASGKTFVMLMPMLNGAPAIAMPIAVDLITARKLGNQLIDMANRAGRPRLITTPQFTKVPLVNGG